MSIAKIVAIFILVFVLSFSAVLVVNAEAREKVFDWIIERFPKFSVFIEYCLHISPPVPIFRPTSA